MFAGESVLLSSFSNLFPFKKEFMDALSHSDLFSYSVLLAALVKEFFL